MTDLCFETESESFHDEIRRHTRKLARFNIRYHLAVYPKDLLRHWWNAEGGLPSMTSRIAYQHFNAGEAPRRRLYKGRPHRPQLKLIEAGATQS